MGVLIAFAEAILSRASGRAEIAAQNISNLTTPGYKSRASFQALLTASPANVRTPDAVGSKIDWSPGKIVQTHNPLDLAISGDGFFAVRSGDKLFYTRNGQFQRDADGHLVTADGMVLQATTGDASVPAGVPAIAPDGTIREDGKDAGQIVVVDFKDKSGLVAMGNGCFAAPTNAAHAIDTPRVVQGAVEQSNASDATEMLSMMASLRSAETGQHIVQLYDDLMAQAATGFGQGQS